MNLSSTKGVASRKVLKHQALFHPTIMQYIQYVQSSLTELCNITFSFSSVLKLRYSGTWRREIWHMITSVSEEPSTSIFKVDDRGSTLFRKVGSHLPNYTASYSGRYCSEKLSSNKLFKLCLNYVVFRCGGTTFSRAVTGSFTLLVHFCSQRTR
jgi:hypothetical protein